MSFELAGKLIVKNEEQQITATFKKREFVIEQSTEYNGKEYFEYIKLQLLQDKCSTLDSFNVGDMVKVSFNVKGSKWEKEGKVNYFVNLNAWKVERDGDTEIQAPEPTPTTVAQSSVEEADDLPF